MALSERGRRALIGVFAAALVAGACCGERGAVAAPAPPGDRGDLRYQAAVTDPDPAVTAAGAREYVIRYSSTSGVDGTRVDVGAAVFVPGGAAPAGGRPIVSFGHGTTGITDECAPSHYRNLYGYLDAVMLLVRRGFVVVATDYEGLGTPGAHPYLDPSSAAFDMIDAVRATRQLVPSASTRWAAMGESQGGQASWAAAERADSYGTGLSFVGAANLSPAADLSQVVPGFGGERPTIAQEVFLPLLIAGLRVRHPTLDESAYLHGPLWRDHDVLVSCTNQNGAQKLKAAMAISPADAQPRTVADARRLHDWLAADALPRTRSSGPMLVLVGGKDPLILPEWTAAAVRRACAMGDVVDFIDQPDHTHASAADIVPAVDWIADRFAGAPVPNTCDTGFHDGRR